MKFCSLVLELYFPQNFCLTHTDRHFPEIVKSCSEHPKTCKSIENRKSKICTIPILSSTYIEESKKIRLSLRGAKISKITTVYSCEFLLTNTSFIRLRKHPYGCMRSFYSDMYFIQKSAFLFF